MQNFLKIADGVNVQPVMVELFRNSDLWDENTLRTKHPGTAHSQVSDILVWFNDLKAKDIVNDKEVIPFRAWSVLPSLRPIIFGLMNHVQAHRLGRVIITKLPPGKEITPHVDGGAPATYFQRYQLALQSQPGCLFTIDGEIKEFKTGEIWQIDNQKTHSVQNHSADDRIACIIDLRSE